MDAAALAGLAVLALVDSTSVGTLVLPLVLLTQPVVRPRRVVLHLAAVGILATSTLGAPVAGAVVVGYVAVVLAPATALLLVRLAAGERLAAPLTRARQWLAARTAGALGWVIGLAGLLLLIGALRVLGGRGLLWW